MPFEFSGQQATAVGIAADFLSDSSRQVLRIDGFAGTGKTTIAQALSEGIDGLVLFAAYTGKAASVLKSKGCAPASTLHSLIYRPRRKGSEERLEALQIEEKHLRRLVGPREPTPQMKERLDKLGEEIAIEVENSKRPAFSIHRESELYDAKLLVIDEHSMIDEQMGNDILSFRTKILALGDPAQLPPVSGVPFFASYPVAITLTEIHRQAEGDPIIELATMARNGSVLPAGEYGEKCIVKTSATDEDLVEADQVLCGRNRTRRMLNTRIRRLLGRNTPYPVVGDKLVCLRNEQNKGLQNGTTWMVVGVGAEGDKTLMLDVANDEGWSQTVRVWKFPFDGDDFVGSFGQRRMACEFDFGNAMTVHKAQGSQWVSGVLVDEAQAFGDDAPKHRYTGVTRFSEKLIVVRG